MRTGFPGVASYKRSHIRCFHLYKTSRIGKSIDRVQNGGQGWWKEGRGSYCLTDMGFLLGDETVFKLDRSSGYTILWMWLILLYEFHKKYLTRKIKESKTTNNACCLVFASKGSSMEGSGERGQVWMKQNWPPAVNCWLEFIIFIFCLCLKNSLKNS